MSDDPCRGIGRASAIALFCCLGSVVPLVVTYAAGTPARATAAVDRAEAAVGEPVRYTLTLQAPESAQPQLRPVGERLGPCAIDDRGGGPATARGAEEVSQRAGAATDRSGPMTQRRDGAQTVTWSFLLSCDEPGSVSLPSPTIVIRDAAGAEQEAHAEPIALTVRSRLPKDWQHADIRDAKPPVWVWPRWWWLALLIAAVALVVGIRWWRVRRPAAPPPPPVPPHERALRALDALECLQLPQQGRFEDYYVRLSAIVRSYIEDRFSLRAPEMTTEEFFDAASNAPELISTHRALLKDFLQRCDLVKFARYRPSDEEASAAMAAARRFVMETRVSEPAPGESAVSGKR